jgi:hypothetical protein
MAKSDLCSQIKADICGFEIRIKVMASWWTYNNLNLFQDPLTKAEPILKNEIPVRVFFAWDEWKPGGSSR